MEKLTRVEKVMVRNQLVIMKALDELLTNSPNMQTRMRLSMHIGYTHQFVQDHAGDE